MHRCYVCRDFVKEANHIGIDNLGDPKVCCEKCYDRAKIFFDEAERRKNNAKFRGSSEASQ